MLQASQGVAYALAMAHLPRACIVMPIDEQTLALLREGCDPIVLTPPFDRATLLREIATAEGFLGPAPFPIDAELLDAAPGLRVISNFGVGFNNVDLPDVTRRGIAVCNTPGVLSAAVADLTLLMILAASRHFCANAGYVASGGWARGETPPPLGWDVTGRTLGIIGFGRIGREVATRAEAFGMQCIHHDVEQARTPKRIPPVSLDELLARSDIVTLHVNLTAETHHLISRRELALMKPSAWLVNTSRGPVVDQPALLETLRGGGIAGAALDVLEVEPPPLSEELVTLPNVIALPHIGSATVETRAAMLELSVRNLLAVLGGQRPPSCVNPEALRL